MKTHCPYDDCQQRIEYETDHCGTAVNCPACGREFIVPENASQTTVEASPSLGTEPDLASAEEFAAFHGIRLTEKSPSTPFKTDKEAEEWVNAALEETARHSHHDERRLFDPSGKMPLTAYVFLAIGACVALPVAIFGGSLLASLLLSGAAGFDRFLGSWAEGTAKYVFLYILYLIITMGSLSAVQFFVIGKVLCWFARLGRARRPAVFAWTAVPLGMISAIAMQWFVSSKDFPDHTGFDGDLSGASASTISASMGNFTPVEFRSGWELVMSIAMVIIVGIGSAYIVMHSVLSGTAFTFCESCERSLRPQKSPSLGLGGIETMSHAIRDENSRELIPQILERAAGKDGNIMVIHCATCGNCELTGRIKIHAKSVKGGGNIGGKSEGEVDFFFYGVEGEKGDQLAKLICR